MILWLVTLHSWVCCYRLQMGDVLVHLYVLASFLVTASNALKPYVRSVLHDEFAG